MTTTADPETDRRDDDDVEQPEQQHRDAPATADAHLDGIDAVLADAENGTQPGDLTDEGDEGDPRPDSLLAALKTLVPPHAFFQTQSKIPGVVKSLAQAIGAETPEINAYQVIWTAGEGGWREPGIYQLGWMPQGCVCGKHPDTATGYRLEINAPGITMHRNELTVEDAVAILQALRVVR